MVRSEKLSKQDAERLPYRSFQVKVAGTILPSVLHERGAEYLGHVVFIDTYLNGPEDWRIREDPDHHEHHVLSQRKITFETDHRLQETSGKPISHDEAEALMRTHGVRLKIFKERTIYRLHDVQVVFDRVEQLGDFVEIRATTPEIVADAIRTLGLSGRERIIKSYPQLLEEIAIPQWRSAMQRFHEKVGQFAYGITSGTLTTVGLLVGMDAATSSVLAVIAGLSTIAIADASSDAFSMYVSRMAQRGVRAQEALRAALGTWTSKCIVPLTFILPVVLLPLQRAVMVDVILACVVLALLAAEQAIVTQTSVARAVGKYLSLAVAVLALSRAAGWLAGKLVG